MSFLAPQLQRPPPALAADIARRAVMALLAELRLYPKPGLVSPVDSGAHADMDAGTFRRSLAALRPCFARIAAAGAGGLPFEALRSLAIEAERRMLAATGGVNTHRGAIFCLGLLAAAAGWRQARGLGFAGDALADTALALWGDGIAEAARVSSDSHGSRAVRRYGARGARDEALNGFPTLFDAALPALETTLALTGCAERGQVQCLFAAMAELEDTNLLHRGGPAGLAFVQGEARRFLAEGGALAPDWRAKALALHRACVARSLSPGGAADVLAAALFVHGLRP